MFFFNCCCIKILYPVSLFSITCKKCNFEYNMYDFAADVIDIISIYKDLNPSQFIEINLDVEEFLNNEKDVQKRQKEVVKSVIKIWLVAIIQIVINAKTGTFKKDMNELKKKIGDKICCTHFV